MYNPGITIHKPGTGYAANGKIEVTGILDGYVVFNMTTPWGSVETGLFASATDAPLERLITLYNPTRNCRYIVKILSVTSTNATFQVLSYVDDASVANYIDITNNLPTDLSPGQSTNYIYTVTNNSPSSIQIRYLLASTDDTEGPITDRKESLPPTSYRNVKCWYNNWAASGDPCQIPLSISNGQSKNISGTMSVSSTPGIYTNMMLRVFVYKPEYWKTTPGLPGINPDPTGGEYVAPQLSGYDIKSVLSNLCAGLPSCSNICIKDPVTGIWNTWSQQCNPSIGSCEPISIITPDDPTCCTANWICEPGRTGYEIDGCGHRRANNLCTATHYAEFDISFLPTDWLNYVGSEITDISNTLATYLPTFDNIQYIGASYVNKKFRLYFVYTPQSLTISIGDPIYILNTIRLNKEYNLHSEIKTLITIGLGDFVAFIAGIVVFLLGMKFLTWAFAFGGPIFALAVGAIVVGIAAVVLKYIIYDMSTGTSTSTENPSAPPPDQQIKIIREYSDTYGRPACDQLYPTCSTTPPTCNTEDMKGYNKCRGSWDMAQVAHDDTKSGTFDQEKYDALKKRIEDIDTCLTNGTCATQDAKNDIDNRKNEANQNSQDKQDLTTCTSGELYDVNQKKCIAVEQCAIKNPLTGTCILTKSGAGMIAIAGIALIGGLIILKFIPSKK